MQDAHGQLPDGAVGGLNFSRYARAMKTHLIRNSYGHRSPDSIRLWAGRELLRDERPEAIVPPRRRYPSLAGDNYPWLPPEPTLRRSAMAALFPRDARGISLVRAVSLVAILGIIAALAAGS